ncbi:unnamed protein product [Gadus morhua 'NCC']
MATGGGKLCCLARPGSRTPDHLLLFVWLTPPPAPPAGPPLRQQWSIFHGGPLGRAGERVTNPERAAGGGGGSSRTRAVPNERSHLSESHASQSHASQSNASQSHASQSHASQSNASSIPRLPVQRRPGWPRLLSIFQGYRGFSSPHIVWDSLSPRRCLTQCPACFLIVFKGASDNACTSPTLLQRRLSSDPAARLLETPPHRASGKRSRFQRHYRMPGHDFISPDVEHT